jgi:hypothetical protein
MKTPKIFDQNGNLTKSNDTIISMDNVIDEFVATKRSENTKRAYSKDLSDTFEYIGITELNELGVVQL